MKMDKKTLRNLQIVELEILEFLDAFCRENEIKYSLYAGTALGAVRHKGFIPWDDDIDVCMPRDEYEKFIEIWRGKAPKGYYLQGTDDINNRLNHSKIRKDKTILYEETIFSESEHKGIFIDIFPMDVVSANKIKLRLISVLAICRFFFTRRVKYNEGKGILGKMSAVLLLLPDYLQRAIKNQCEKIICSNKGEPSCFMSLNSIEELGMHWPNDMFNEITSIEFEKKQFSIVKDYDEMLRITFGDYMTLPPIEERVCKHSVKVIFDTEKEAF